jgi:hypothetical protein
MSYTTVTLRGGTLLRANAKPTQGSVVILTTDGSRLTVQNSDGEVVAMLCLPLAQNGPSFVAVADTRLLDDSVTLHLQLGPRLCVQYRLDEQSATRASMGLEDIRRYLLPQGLVELKESFCASVDACSQRFAIHNGHIVSMTEHPMVGLSIRHARYTVTQRLDLYCRTFDFVVLHSDPNLITEFTAIPRSAALLVQLCAFVPAAQHIDMGPDPIQWDDILFDLNQTPALWDTLFEESSDTEREEEDEPSEEDDDGDASDLVTSETDVDEIPQDGPLFRKWLMKQLQP